METVKMGDGKILIILTGEEVASLGAGAGAEYAVAALLPGIAASGFASPRDTLNVELFESADGGCQIFITREERESVDYIKNGCSVDPSFFKRGKKAEKCSVSYRFDELQSLFGACRELSLSYRGESSFSEADGAYYLTLSEGSPIPGEFGGREADRSESALIAERGSDALYAAVERLGAFAV